ncbi:MAG: SUMF1/EgtB/PvdO family nonheme iron enzyme, partial [Bacteroidota bacterium]|nr:SUMF1/EgtB/PvdO family nonheme iron enzyme [Bacteroidota bacterium]
MRNYFVIGLVLTLLYSCGSFDNGELIGVQDKHWSEPQPYGMVLVKQGTFELGQADVDSLFGLNTPSKRVSVGSFWMDQTEITNGQYKEFIQWVCDSIIREKLADPNYGGNEEYKTTESAAGEPVTPHLNWKIPIPARRRATDEELKALNYFTQKDEVLGKNSTNTDLVLYKYEWFDYEAAAKRENQLQAIKRNKNTDIAASQLPQVMITKDTAYLTEAGQVVRTSITRPLSSRYDFLNTYIVAVYPDTTCWINDFTNSYNDPYLHNYFSHPAYNAYPVV